MKHAFEGKGGEIAVWLTAGIGYGQARLSVTDNGRGIQNPRPNGTGLNMTSLLAKQIGADLGQQSDKGGTTTDVTFPVIV